MIVKYSIDPHFLFSTWEVTRSTYYPNGDIHHYSWEIETLGL